MVADARGWKRSSLSTANGQCVEVAAGPGGGVLVRDSKDLEGPVLSFSGPVWDAFVADVKRYACYAGF